jgi:catechol 2,3-dioxygenase-like lactoylglutathione lyase family enzyme
VLARFPLNPILPAQDGARAEAFYRDVLGLDQLSAPGTDPMAFGAGNGSMIVLSELRDRTPPAYPVVSFLVEASRRSSAPWPSAASSSSPRRLRASPASRARSRGT